LVLAFVCVFCRISLLTFSCKRILMLLTWLSSNYIRTSLTITMLIKFLPSQLANTSNYYGLPTMQRVRMSALVCLFCFTVLVYFLFVCSELFLLMFSYERIFMLLPNLPMPAELQWTADYAMIYSENNTSASFLRNRLRCSGPLAPCVPGYPSYASLRRLAR
jgi:hypothetical protein